MGIYPMPRVNTQKVFIIFIHLTFRVISMLSQWLVKYSVIPVSTQSWTQYISKVRYHYSEYRETLVPLVGFTGIVNY